MKTAQLICTTVFDLLSTQAGLNNKFPIPATILIYPMSADEVEKVFKPQIPSPSPPA